MKIISILLFACFAGVAAGCVSTVIKPLPQNTIKESKLLSFIETGNTTRDEVINRLGQPYSVYQEQRILVYIIDASGYGEFSLWNSVDQYGYKLRPNQNHNVYSLVLVFNPDGLVDRYSLVGSR